MINAFAKSRNWSVHQLNLHYSKKQHNILSPTPAKAQLRSGYEREGRFNDHGWLQYDHAAEPNDHLAGIYERLRLGYERLGGYYDHPEVSLAGSRAYKQSPSAEASSN
ncbi:hypothetical protein NCCP2378_17480 [Sporosarcina sp. NCCP-2378]|nr:hypothetical protein NCCP2378_17480 [Sporosarcina sp. NCCP-2378]